jgi:hypothetical protein
MAKADPSESARGTHARLWQCGRAALVLILAAWVAIGVLRPAVGDPDYFVRYDEVGGLRVQDFASHVRFTRAVWSGLAREGHNSVYTPAAHRRFMRDWTGQPGAVANRALPFGYSATMLLVLGPLCRLSEAWAYAAWTGLGLAAIWWMLSPGRPLALVSALCFLSPPCLACLALGQTALLTTAGLVFLATRSVKEPPNSWWSELAEALILWLLTAKPPVAVTAGVGLLACRRWRPVGLAALMTLLSTLALTPLLGSGWVSDYLQLVSRYNAERADPAFAWSLVPSYMSNLRAILNLYLGIADGTASKIGSLLWAASLAGLMVVAWKRYLTPGKAWFLAILAYVLLAPHVNFTEDLHLYVLGCLPTGMGTVWLVPVGVTGLLWLTPNAPATAIGWRWPVLPFLGKLAVASLTFSSSARAMEAKFRRQEERKDHPARIERD